MGAEGALLLRGGEAREQREDLRVAEFPATQHLLGVADLTLAREEDQNVAVVLAQQFRHGVGERVEGVEVDHPVPVLDLERPVADLHGEGTSGDLDDRGGATVGAREVAGEPFGVDGRGGDDELEVRAPRENLLEVAQEEVDVETAFVCLIDDDRVVGVEQPVAADLREQDAVSHELDRGVGSGAVVEAHGGADGAADLHAEFVRDPLGHGPGGEAPRLGVADHAAHAAPELEADLGDLGGLARAGLAGDHDHLVLADGLRDLVLARADGELLGVLGSGDRLGAPPDALGGLVDAAGQVVELVGAGPADPGAEPVRVEGADLVEPDEQIVAGPAELGWG